MERPEFKGHAKVFVYVNSPYMNPTNIAHHGCWTKMNLASAGGCGRLGSVGFGARSLYSKHKDIFDV